MLTLQLRSLFFSSHALVCHCDQELDVSKTPNGACSAPKSSGRKRFRKIELDSMTSFHAFCRKRGKNILTMLGPIWEKSAKSGHYARGCSLSPVALASA